jgi:hypothetical protein
MFRKGVVAAFLFGFVYSLPVEEKVVQKPMVIKKKKKASKNKIKEQIVDQLDLLLQQSSELIRGLTNLSDESLQCVREIVTNQDDFGSKKEYETCQKRLEGYNKRVREMVEEVRIFSQSLR